MPNIAQVLKQEIRRLSRQEAKAMTMKLKKDVVRLKKAHVSARRHIKQLLRDNELLMKAEQRRQQSTPVIAPATAGKARITSKGIRAMRRKLGLSQEGFARLLKVSSMTVFNWERKKGPLRLREETKAAVLSLRGVGAREAKRRLEMLKE